MNDFVTVLTNADSPQRYMTKKVTATGIAPWQNTALVTSEKVPVRSLAELAAVFDSLSPYQCIIHGEILPGVDPTVPHRRLKHPDARVVWNGHPTTVTTPASYGDAAHAWALFDIDEKGGGFEWLDILCSSPDLLPPQVLALIPPECHKAACHYRLTSSSGITPGVRLRLAFQLDRPLTSAEKTAWLAPYKSLDTSVYRTVQPNYIAAPVFEGVPEPLGDVARTGYVDGEEFVNTPEIFIPEDVIEEEEGDWIVDGRDPSLLEYATAVIKHAEPTSALGKTLSVVIQELIDARTTEGKIFADADVVATLEEHWPFDFPEGEPDGIVARLAATRKHSRGCANIGRPVTYGYRPEDEYHPEDGIIELDIKKEIILSHKTPWISARRFLAANYGGDRRLILYRGDFCVWDGKRYNIISDATIKAELYPFLDAAKVVTADHMKAKKAKKEPEKEPELDPANPFAVPEPEVPELEPFSPNRTKIGDVFDALRSWVHVDDNLEAPAWHPKTPIIPNMPGPRDFLSCANGLLHLPTRRLDTHTPALISFQCLPFAYDSAAPEPAEWSKFLTSVWGDDQASIDTLQEIFGYLLSGATRQQKMFMLVGPTRSGKGTIARVMTELLGPANVCGPTLSSLGGDFGLQPLINKSLAVVSDVRPAPRGSNLVVERLLAISGEDSISVHRKNQTAIEGHLRTRFLLLSNEVPRFPDASAAITGRFIILRLKHSFLGHEDQQLLERLLKELPGILNWGLAGWQRLSERGYFVSPQSSAQSVEEMVSLASPISDFIDDECELGPTKSISRNDLYQHWATWCCKTGRAPGDEAYFGKILSAFLGHKLGTSRPRINGRPTRTYTGICQL